MKRISDKRLKALGGQFPSSTISKKPKPLRKRPRKPSAFKRIYGSKERVAFVRSLACAACGVVGYSENAHVAGESGVGYKADAEFIAPLCGWQPAPGIDYIGCHRVFDEKRSYFDELFPDFNPEDAAAKTQADWLAFSGSPKRGNNDG